MKKIDKKCDLKMLIPTRLKVINTALRTMPSCTPTTASAAPPRHRASSAQPSVSCGDSATSVTYHVRFFAGRGLAGASSSPWSGALKGPADAMVLGVKDPAAYGGSNSTI